MKIFYITFSPVKLLLATAMAVQFLVKCADAANSITVANNSFETNTAGTVFNFKVNSGFDAAGTSDVAGWLNAGSTYNDSGVDYAGHAGITAENGTVVAYCDSGDSGAYQITSYQIQSGDQLTLTWWAKSSYQNAGQSVKLLSGASQTTAFGSLSTLATSTAALNQTGNGGAYTQYTLTYNAVSGDVGKYVAVFLQASGTNGQYAMFDNFALTTSGAVGAVSASHSTVSPALVSLTANGGSTQVITVQARDANNINETSGGETVVFSRTGTGTLSATTDNGDGTYAATLTAPSSTGSATITATLNGTSVGTAVGASQSAATYFSSKFGDAVPSLTGTLTTNFTVGSAGFQERYYAGQGLGPIFNQESCSQCHNFPVFGGSGEFKAIRFGQISGGVYNALTNLDGPLLHPAYIDPHCVETNVPASANVVALREVRPLFGSGLIEAIPDSVIIANAALSNPDGIVGTPALVTDPVDGKQHVGRFGWKGQFATLLSFAADAANNELGRTSRLQPTGHAPGGNTTTYNTYNTLADPNDVIDGTGKADIDRTSDYVRLLGPPPTVALSANATAGQALFHTISCDECHTPTLTTSSAFIPVSDLASETNSSIAALSSKAVNLYSDLALHNMGALNDNIAQGGAGTNQMMTPPLWGLRSSLPYLHNGSAATLDAAIRAHAGDAAAAATRYINLTGTQQTNLVSFLNSL